MLWRRLIMRIFAQAYQWQSYCKKLSNQKKNSSFFHRKQKKSNFYQFPRKIGDSCQGTGTWQRRQRPDARYLSPGRGDALFQQHFCPLWDIVHILFIQSTISSSIKQTRQLIINRVIINICSVNERNSLRCIDQ